jgi:hypothetical protein
MSTFDFPGARWRKSRRSNGQGSCIEVANVRRGQVLAVAVRDSKDPGGPKLPVTREGWRAFITRVKDRDLGACAGQTQRGVTSHEGPVPQCHGLERDQRS